ncbi:hypothetical protein N7931_12250 [Catenovulum sp. 2E275]|uniref:hypothetical protein n=1 Tax=Catenovulum sp. 2E275 TaxID=2980497 RepID=UPI0021CF0751|nr:hypothetical protein [Catenovulum sp. 2E275]MCU4676400.1 hypothetical protein [Catenovulum sp. 2E275]
MNSFLYYVSNGVALLVTLAPLIIILIVSTRKIFPRFSQILFGVAFIVWACICFDYFSDSYSQLTAVTHKSDQELELKTDLLRAFGMWIYAVPAIYLGIGVSMLHNYIRFRIEQSKDK